MFESGIRHQLIYLIKPQYIHGYFVRGILRKGLVMSITTRQRSCSLQFCLILSLIITPIGITGCSDGNNSNSKSDGNYLPIAQPTTEEPPDVGEPLLQLAEYDLGEIGYKENEYFFSGIASAFTNLNSLDRMVFGRWNRAKRRIIKLELWYFVR